MAKKHTIEDYVKLRTLTCLDSSNSAGLVSIISGSITHEKEKARDSVILVLDAASGTESQRISDPGLNITVARLNLDGTKIAYISSNNKKHYLTVKSLSTGLEEKLLLQGEAHQLEWNNDGSIFILMTGPISQSIRDRQEKGDDFINYEADEMFRSLYLYSPGSGFRKITENIQVWEFASSASRIVVVASDNATEGSWYRSKLMLIDPASNKADVLYDPAWRAIAKPRISPDSKKVVFLESLMSDFGVFSGDVIQLDFETRKAKNLTEGHKRSYLDMRWVNESIHMLWSMECETGISSYANNKFTEIWSSKGTVMPFFSADFMVLGSSYVFPFQDNENPSEICILKANGALSRISHENMSIVACDRIPAEVVRWKSSDGMEIYGVFRSAGKNSPVVVDVHGGPTSYTPLTFMDRMTNLVSSGFSIFSPNYRGSVGKGRAYAEANRGDMGGMDFVDILSGMQYLKESGHTDTEKWFITGGSYGGFMTSWAITQTNKFNAAVGLFGISDWVSFHGTTHIADWDSIHYNESPYSGKKYEKFSPLNYVDNVKTPILLLHGIEDPYVPLGQYLQFYRALKDKGKLVQMLMFPREGHGFSETEHVRRSMNETFNWFSRYS
ncbi:MAG: S9 family peptidase [Candidatus Thermoplasmatota archaeon]|nr:S9 family peptidase [Candidatus Thermoplasmatota archaeon]